MTNPPRVAVALDMDGVIFRTTKSKQAAMLSLFPSARRAEFSDLILSMSGVPRALKLARVYEACFGYEPKEQVLENYLSRYAEALQALPIPEATPGIKDFLARAPLRYFVCSSAPANEVEHNIASAGMTQCFEGIYGASTSKAAALNDIRRRVGFSPVVFFGDGMADLRAAEHTGCHFIAVVGELDQFQGQNLPKINDFTDSGNVLNLVAMVLAKNAA